MSAIADGTSITADSAGSDMQQNYKDFIDHVITRYEGNYGWDRNDPGGPTKYGITCYDLAEHRGQRMTSMATWAPIVAAMPLAEAEDIYASKYATSCAFNALQTGADCVVMDFGVNSGPSRAIKFAQIVVDEAQDGVLGPLTLAAINKMDGDRFVDGLCDMRMRFLRQINTWGTFGAGWSARVADLRRYSHALITQEKAAVVQGIASLEVSSFTDKTARISLAFAKAYHPDDLAVPA